MKIEMGKKYRTNNGVSVRRVLCVDGLRDEYPVVVEMETGEISSYSSEGEFQIGHQNDPLNLTEASKWADFKIDDKVMVSHFGAAWYKRHFAGVNREGKPTAFSDGNSSWSSTDKPTIWNDCRRPTKEELK